MCRQRFPRSLLHQRMFEFPIKKKRLQYFHDKILYVDHWFVDLIVPFHFGGLVYCFSTYRKYFWRWLIFSVELQEILVYCLKTKRLYIYIYIFLCLIGWLNVLGIFNRLIHSMKLSYYFLCSLIWKN